MNRIFDFFAIVVLLILATGCSLSAGGGGQRQSRRQVYFNLMNAEQKSQFRRLEILEEPESILLAYLQEIGVYQLFVNQPKEVREAVLRRRVSAGMMPLQVQMAWGLPERTRDVSTAADTEAGRKRVIWDFAFGSEAGWAQYQRSVCFVNDRVLWMRSKVP